MPVLYFAFPFCLFSYYHNRTVSWGWGGKQAWCLAGIPMAVKITWFSVWNVALPSSQYSFGLVQVASSVCCLVLAVLGNWEMYFFCYSVLEISVHIHKA